VALPLWSPVIDLVNETLLRDLFLPIPAECFHPLKHFGVGIASHRALRPSCNGSASFSLGLEAPLDARILTGLAGCGIEFRKSQKKGECHETEAY
jgi:hypothetical protein